MGRVLVASTDGELRKHATAELALGGHEALLSTDPIEAVRLAVVAGLSGVVLDLELPDPGGDALLERLLVEPACASLPVLTVTPVGSEIRNRAGRIAVIRRPYGRAELSSALSLLLTTPVGAKAQADRNPSAVGISAVRSLRHDMNNPLSVVLGQVEILETDKRELPADVRRCLGEIRTAAEKVCDIILSVVLGQVEILEINNRELPADVCGRLGKIRMAAEQMRDTIVRSRSGDEEENENSEGDVAR